jgi:prepilin-type N-terminal cleavage/methylation domain-containing protein
VIARRAFTMIEMMVVIFLIGLVATITIPRLAYKSPHAEWKMVLDDLNNLVIFARQEAISNQKIYRLTFSPNGKNPDTVSVEVEGQDPEKLNKKVYSPVTGFYLNTRYEFHPSIKLKAFYHGKKEQMNSGEGDTHCYIVPDGLVQDILIHMSKIENNLETKSTFKMLPFYGKFELLDGFVRPE